MQITCYFTTALMTLLLYGCDNAKVGVTPTFPSTQQPVTFSTQKDNPLFAGTYTNIVGNCDDVQLIVSLDGVTAFESGKMLTSINFSNYARMSNAKPEIFGEMSDVYFYHTSTMHYFMRLNSLDLDQASKSKSEVVQMTTYKSKQKIASTQDLIELTKSDPLTNDVMYKCPALVDGRSSS